ncbi:hypothetical protein GQ600_11127 [Phytophthora cactorum]|nr:hypothetical protein GQ600_11127 [Phytophthora cactorum]
MNEFALERFNAAFVQKQAKPYPVNVLLFADDMFAGIDPSVTKPHSASKLLRMSKEVIKNYFVAEQRFTTSGQHESEYGNFVDKRGAVLYMRKWLQIRY